MQHHGQLARQRDLGLAEAAALGDPNGPGLQGAPATAMVDQHVGCLIQRTSHPGVAGATDPAGPVHLAGLEPPRRQTEVGADRAGVAEPCGVVHASGIRQGHKRAHAGHRHQPLGGGVGLDLCGDLLVQPGNLAVEVLDDSDKRLQQRRQRLVVQ